jgi:hypothetical protein
MNTSEKQTDKAVFGPIDMVFNGKQSVIVEETIKIIEDYQRGLSGLNLWLADEKRRIESEYVKRKSVIIEKTESALKKYSKQVNVK